MLVQSMTNTDTRDREATLAQIESLAACGCGAVRVAVPDDPAADGLRWLCDRASVPLIADIHFDWRLAVRAAESGMAGVRINPGNLGGPERLARVADSCAANGACIRAGVNSGSIEKDILREFGRPCADAMVKSALRWAAFLEARNFHNFKLSLKSSSVMETVEACRKISRLCDHPLHIGVTEAGTRMRGAVKSAVGLGLLLAEGIGDTIRVSLTAPPEEEAAAAYEILRSLGLGFRGPEIISCPGCGRTEINLYHMAEEVEKKLHGSALPVKVAVMGCVVNGPGEAREADIGLAGGRGRGVIFRKGRVIRSVQGEAELLAAFMEELDRLAFDQPGPDRPRNV